MDEMTESIGWRLTAPLRWLNHQRRMRSRGGALR
jgi:hypothetical protein